MICVHARQSELEKMGAPALSHLVLAQMERIENLELQVAKFRRAQFGPKSEKAAFNQEQLALCLSGCVIESVQPEPADQQQGSTEKPERARNKSRALPAHLPREVRTYLPKDTNCPCCNGELRKLGEDASEMIEYMPASFFVIRHVRPKMSCRKCSCVVQAPAPARVIDRGLPGPNLLAHVVVAKYCDHSPLHRQSQVFAREGIDLDRSILARWIGEVAALLEPVAEVLRRYVLDTEKLHGDDTPLPVLAPGTGKTKTGRFWTYVRDNRSAGDKTAPAVWFAYSPDRKGQHPQKHLAEFTGILQADAFAGFNKLYGGGLIQEAPCMAHIRRKFFDLVKAHNSPIAAEAVTRIAALYRIEKQIKGRPPDERRTVRSSQARPLFDDLRRWLEQALTQLTPKSETAAAIHYALGLWDALARYLDDGRIELDNLIAERALRPRSYRPPQLPVRRLGFGWAPSSDPLWSDWNSAIERPGPGSLPALRARTNRRASDLSHRGVAAMERSRKTSARITKSRIELPGYFNSPFAITMYPHIDEFTERGQIVIGHMDPVGPVAIASEGRNTIAMLRRGKEETFKQLLARLDLAIESATVDEVYIDEVNTAEG